MKVAAELDRRQGTLTVAVKLGPLAFAWSLGHVATLERAAP